MSEAIFTNSEQKAFDSLLEKSGRIVNRDDIAQKVWGVNWLSKYSDWQIDRLIYLLRHKIGSNYKITTVRNSGYILTKAGFIVPPIITKSKKVPGISPSNSYLEYMNNPRLVRKVLKDLFISLGNKLRARNALVINSYSGDNVDAAVEYFGKNTEIYFTNFDSRALKIHSDRVEKLKLNNVHVNFDDIRNSSLKDNFFDVIVNDFRLNFNSNDEQNTKAVTQMKRILKPRGLMLISVVVDARYESERFGTNQEKAPTNKDKPWTFMADEGLERKCFTVPYYKRLFKKAGLSIVKEFDINEGKIWFKKFNHYKETHQPAYRRYMLKAQ